MDYQALREAGIADIQRLATDLWTDHNAHDPGITILEQFCYALTDLNYRAGFPIQDLMAEGGAKAWPETYRPRPLLTTAPISLEDWRKLLLDIPGIRNVWINVVDTLDPDYSPAIYYDEIDGILSLDPVVSTQYADTLALQGLYQIDYVLDETYGSKQEQVEAEIAVRVRANRNLCEDLYEINRLQEDHISVEARIEIEEVPDPELLLARIYNQIRIYCSPIIQFYSLQDLLAKGYLMDDIMDGPMLQHGFLDEEELATFGVRKSLRISDLIGLIMSIEGVQAVYSLKINSSSGDMASSLPGDAWELFLPSRWVARLQIPTEASSEQGIKLWNQELERSVDWNKSWNHLHDFILAERAKKSEKSLAELDHHAPLGRDRSIASYQSIFHQFPDVYGIGLNGLPENSSIERKAQAMQLKGYLSFFDQLLANSFSQLAGMRKLFGLDEKVADLEQTYFGQSLLGETPGFEDLVEFSLYEELLKDSGVRQDETQLRKKRMIYHLLARFGEAFTNFSQESFEQQITLQQNFLQSYAALGYRRCTGFDYSQPSWNNTNVSGLALRLSYLLGFPQTSRILIQELPTSHRGAFHLVEHILLRPSLGDNQQGSPLMLLPFNGDEQQAPQKDPYSLQLSFVFPDWLDRFSDNRYRQFLIKTLREQTPAHLRLYVHWLNQDQMKAFESAFQDWLYNLQAMTT
ncbi:MAG: hypothetical protein AAF587_16940 [Bacteroidota bacterium]